MGLLGVLVNRVAQCYSGTFPSPRSVPQPALVQGGNDVINRMRFLDDTLQHKLIAATAALGIEYWVEDESLCTNERDWSVVWDVRDEVRSSAFPTWHEWRGGGAKDPGLYDRYRQYMVANGVRYVEVEEDGSRWFLLGPDDDPYSWGIEEHDRP
jgi:hypothetical protein